MSSSTTKDVYIVIGGSGFVGRHIVNALLARGDTVSIFDMVQRYHDVPFYTGDLTEEGSVSEALRKVCYVYLLYGLALTKSRVVQRALFTPRPLNMGLTMPRCTGRSTWRAQGQSLPQPLQAESRSWYLPAPLASFSTETTSSAQMRDFHPPKSLWMRITSLKPRPRSWSLLRTEITDC